MSLNGSQEELVPTHNISDETEEERLEMEQILSEPYRYITQVSGKEIRLWLIKAFDAWMNVSEEKLNVVKDVTKMLHNASLLIDDIEDNSKLRRGIPVAHSVFGVPQTINCANYIYFKCMAMVAELSEPLAVHIFTEQLLELHRGQGMDIYWRDSVQCPSEKQYREMVKRKTGGLFNLAVRLMQAFSDNKTDYSVLLELLGLYFQIRDDYANLVSGEYAANKSYCEDITEGKFSFPIIHCIHSDPSDHQMINILKQHTSDVDLKKHCVERMTQTGSFAYTVKVLEDLEEKVLLEIDRLGGNDLLIKLVNELRKLYREKSDKEESKDSTKAK